MLNARSIVFSLALGLSVLLAVPACEKAPEPAPSSPKTSAPTPPAIEKKQLVDWCKEHGVPESACTRCNADLVAGFKAKGDWCEKHGLPDSHCIACHPELDAKFKAMAPKSGG